MIRGVAFLPGAGLFMIGCVALVGCNGAPQGPSQGGGQPVKVSVSRPIQREITDYSEYTGRTAAVDAVGVRARVSGYLQTINYAEGSEVGKDAVLYQIDPRPYEAALNQAQAQVKLQQAQLAYNEAVYQRNVRLGTTSQAVSAEEVQQSRAQRESSAASLEAAKAAVDQAKLNLDWTRVTSPIDGLIGRTLITKGNLVQADQTLLTTIVSQDPMYVYFDVDEPTALHVQRLIREGKYKSAREQGAKVPVFIGLSIEQGFPHEGFVDFINNQVVPGTGTLPIRGVLANPKPPRGPRLFSAGLFVRVRVAVSAPYQALLITQAALGTDQNRRFVYVVDDKNEVVRRDVVLGPPQGNALQVVTKGLSPNDRVIVSGIQHVRPKVVVDPQPVPMPEGAPDDADASAPQDAPPAPSPPTPQPAPSMKQSDPPRGQTR